VANAWPSYLVLTALAGAALVVAAWVRDPALIAHVVWPRFAAKPVIYLVYGTVQAVVFFGWLQTRVRTIAARLVSDARLVRPLAALTVAGLFAAAHTPNWPLAALSLGAGLVWSWLYFARPNVLLMGASHGVLGAIVYVILGLYTRIGPFYAHPQGWIARYAIPGLHDLVGDLF
jgi:membrane protease YdiL (CAAX protease family)